MQLSPMTIGREFALRVDTCQCANCMIDTYADIDVLIFKDVVFQWAVELNDLSEMMDTLQFRLFNATLKAVDLCSLQ